MIKSPRLQPLLLSFKKCYLREVINLTDEAGWSSVKMSYGVMSGKMSIGAQEQDTYSYVCDTSCWPYLISLQIAFAQAAVGKTGAVCP